MDKVELAKSILEEVEARPLRPDESADEIISDAALCGCCFEEVVPQQELDEIVAKATDIDHWHDLLVGALERHPCSSSSTEREVTGADPDEDEERY
jgi:hypothetical protein